MEGTEHVQPISYQVKTRTQKVSSCTIICPCLDCPFDSVERPKLVVVPFCSTMSIWPFTIPLLRAVITVLLAADGPCDQSRNFASSEEDIPRETRPRQRTEVMDDGSGTTLAVATADGGAMTLYERSDMVTIRD